MKRFGLLCLCLLCLLALVACNSGRSGHQMANVRIGLDSWGSQAPQGGLTPLGVPTDPETGAIGVTEAEVFLTRNGVPVYFDAGGNEVEQGDSAPIILTEASSARFLKLMYGTYYISTVGRDWATPVPNVLATGAWTYIVNSPDPAELQMHLVSSIASASLSAPSIVRPNQVFDVLLGVHPPGRVDLNLPTSDYNASYVVSGGATQAASDLGVRVWAECREVVINAFAIPNDVNRDLPSATVSRTIPVDFTCPSVDGTVDIDMIPPFVQTFPPLGEMTVPVNANFLSIPVEVADFQSLVGIASLYEGVELLDSVFLGQDHVIFEFADAWRPQETGSYDFALIASDFSGNESRYTFTVYVVEP